MIQTPIKRIVDDEWSVFHGKVVKVKEQFGIIVDAQSGYSELYYDCWCEDNSGGGIFPENVLKPISDDDTERDHTDC